MNNGRDSLHLLHATSACLLPSCLCWRSAVSSSTSACLSHNAGSPQTPAPPAVERQHFRLAALRECHSCMWKAGISALPYEAAVWLLEEEEEIKGGHVHVGGQVGTFGGLGRGGPVGGSTCPSQCFRAVLCGVEAWLPLCMMVERVMLQRHV